MDGEEMIGCRVVAIEAGKLHGIRGLTLEAEDGARFVAFPHTATGEDVEIICDPEDKVYRGWDGYPAVRG